jgi:methylthioribose-1-phosphate isomerase
MMGAHVPKLIRTATVLTHCNAGALATAGYGTALGVIRAAHEAAEVSVIATERGRFCKAHA